MNRKIKTVETEEEKAFGYKHQLNKYKKAIKEEFYLEAICIVYGIFESQLYNFLHLSGCINKNMKWTKFKYEIRQIWGIKKGGHSNIKNISGKRNYILKMLSWVEQDNLNIDFNPQSHDKFINELKKEIAAKIDSNALKANFTKMKEWCDIRNEIIHGLLNKSIADLEEKQKACAIDGIEIAQELYKIMENYNNNNQLCEKFKIKD